MQPFIHVFHEEAFSFWTFTNFMKNARENFRTDEAGIMTKIELVKAVLGSVNPEVLEMLTRIGAGSCHFAYRMLLVYLSRELSFHDTMLFWEVMWAENRLHQQGEVATNQTPEFIVFAVVAIVLEKESTIFRACTAESDVVEMVCNLNIDVWQMICNARHVRKQWLQLNSTDE